MSDEFDWLNDERWDSITEEEIEDMHQEELKRMKFKCKPCYNFQSVEFDYEVNSPEDLKTMFGLYKDVIDGLIEISPDQPDKVRKPVAPAEPLATPKPKQIMDQYSIPYTSKTTQKEATQKIQASIDKYKALKGE